MKGLAAIHAISFPFSKMHNHDKRMAALPFCRLKSTETSTTRLAESFQSLGALGEEPGRDVITPGCTIG